MADYVIDTNVWVEVDKVIGIGNVESVTEIDCIKRCRDWLRAFARSEDRLVLDLTWQILKEYRKRIAPGGLARRLLDQLETQPRLRLVEVQVEWDENKHAKVPEECAIPDRDDRKFVAVALAHEPRPPIINAVDSDWVNARGQLAAVGITIQELCPEYIEEKLEDRGT